MNSDALMTVKTYATEVAAEVAASCLEANGIQYMLTVEEVRREVR